MICNYCDHSSSKLHHHYNIEQVKVRFNPTYSHAQIFNQNGTTAQSVRCTPTFHSTAFNVDGYRPLTNQHLKRGEQQKESIVNYKNVSLERKQEELNPVTKAFDLKLRNQWYDPAKEELFKSLCSTERYSRDRKLADLSSNPVFGGPTLIITSRQPEPTPQESIAGHKEKQTQKPKVVDLQPQNQDREMQQQKNVQKFETTKGNTIENTKQRLPKKEEVVKEVVSPQQYSIGSTVTFGQKGSGRKVGKNVGIQATKPAFTIIKAAQADF